MPAPYVRAIGMLDVLRTYRPVAALLALTLALTGAAPLAQLGSDKVADVNKWFAEAGDVSPPAGRGDDERIPF